MEQQEWTQVVGAATKAPSIHNTQPWRFTATADQLDLYVDPGRALPVLDPTGRQQVISCGVAVEFAVVALAAAGWLTEVELLPDAGDGDHLATLRLIGPIEATALDRELAAAIDHRHTVRDPFQPRDLPAQLLDRLQAEAGAFGAWFKPVTRSEEEVATVFLIDRAEEMEQGDPAYLAELQSWLRTDPAAVDGVPVEAVPSGDPHQRPSNWTIRDFVVGTRPHAASGPAHDPDAPPPEVERPTVVLMGTDGDDRYDWLQAGRALGRVLLLATSAGIAASSLTQALDWPATRARLRTRLSLVGYPQMLLRMGYPQEGAPVAASGRRPVDEVLAPASDG
ncbi:Nitroreductase family protein [Blastococcus aurantiacus]|uniref:Nitroreductase family protein n=1 Tax=Blastococcus aurantiacus TaxID=1550231 RepID=A0A1G7P9E2_9ACTN|nr:nitroreductase family protein [Blastococcus aurantiacus]SDF82824.1 Nitroreductase family protein [Blastococcus aurantiacus]